MIVKKAMKNTKPPSDEPVRIVKDLLSALEICLESEKPNWTSEHDSEVAIRKAREFLAEIKTD